MNPRLAELLERVRRLEDEIEAELTRRRAELHADFENRRVHFEQAVLDQQRRFKTGLLKYLLGANPLVMLTAPVIYAALLPLVLADLIVSLYQWVCFPVYGIARVRRRDYFVYDRTHLAYLNILEKINCAYCSYANGLASYLKEIVARTEQYWCPIKHARRVLQAHAWYGGFVDFGDAETYRKELATLRAELARVDGKADASKDAAQ